MERRQLKRTGRGRAEVLEALRNSRFSHGIICPRCGAVRVHKWGSFSDRQRYRCLDCRRTFSDLTGTPAAHLKKVELLPAYARCLEQTLTIRAAAGTLGVHPSTAFRWRHRLLGVLLRSAQPKLGGWIELRSDWFPHSRKGERFCDRVPRRRGPRYRVYYRGPRATVHYACDRLGNVVSCVTSARSHERINADVMELLLAGRVEGSPSFVIARPGPEARWARRHGVRLIEASRGPLAWPTHDRTVWDYRLRVRRWLPRFHGVATRYLPNYLSWHRLLDGRRRNGPRAAVLRWPLGSGFG